MTADRLAALERELAQERRARQALVASSIQLNSLVNLPDLLHAIVGRALELLDAESGALLMLDEGANELVFEVATGETGPSIKDLRMPADQGIAGWVLSHDEPALVNDIARLYQKLADALVASRLSYRL